jgi:hypothetical protein
MQKISNLLSNYNVRIKSCSLLGNWAWITFYFVFSIVMYADSSRWINPIGEKNIPSWAPGQNDFSYPYLGARAILAGVNPYHNNLPQFTSQFFRVKKINGVEFKQIYPPGHLLTYVPFAYLYGDNWEMAGRFFFHLSLIALFIVSFFLWRLLREVTEVSLSPLFVFFFWFCLTLNTGTGLGLERGQADNFIALLSWAATLLFFYGFYGAAFFFGCWGVLMKGYPVLLTLGLGLLALNRESWKRIVSGGLLASAIFVLPVLPYMKDGIIGTLFRSNLYGWTWFNHSFKNIAFSISPVWGDFGRYFLSGIALIVVVLTWILARRALRIGDRAAQVLWLTLFATSSLGTVVGVSSLSVSYNLIQVLPGALFLVGSQQYLALALQLRGWQKNLLGVTLLISLCLLFVFRLAGTIAGSGYGLIGLLGIIGVLAVMALNKNESQLGFAQTQLTFRPSLEG